jgi:hypothetical protein
MYKLGKLATMGATLIAAIAVSAFRGPRAQALFFGCGDGIVSPELGEVCDDGDTATGVCCSSCQIAVAGTGCSGATLCSLDGVCDGTGSDSNSCVAQAPRTGCRHALKSMLVLKKSDGTRDKLVWKWMNGDQTSLEDFGMPTGTTSYALCVFAGPTNTAIRQTQTHYDSFSFWSAISNKGYNYRYSFGDKVILRAGDQDKAKALMSVRVPNPTLNLPLPVTAQLINSANDICFEGVYDTGDVIRNDASRFKAIAR